MAFPPVVPLPTPRAGQRFIFHEDSNGAEPVSRIGQGCSAKDDKKTARCRTILDAVCWVLVSEQMTTRIFGLALSGLLAAMLTLNALVG